MDLTLLSKDQLQDEFLKINARYIRISAGQPSDYMYNKEFLAIREQLHAVLNELERRRNVI